MEIIRGRGRLTHPVTDDGLADVSYVINHQPPTKSRMGEWSGSIRILQKYNDAWDLFDQLGEDMNLELEDGRSGRIIVNHWTPIPSDSPAQFVGNGPLK